MRAARAPARAAAEPVEQFLSAAVTAFDAVAGDGAMARDILVDEGERPIRVRLRVAKALEGLLPALDSRLRPCSGRPDLELRAFAGPGLPSPPWSRSDYLPRDEVRGCTAGRFRAALAVEPRIVNLLDLETGAGVFWCADPASLPYWEAGAPFRHLLHWGLAGHGWQLVHGAAVGARDGDGVLLVGAGGSGKSTATVSCLAAGMLSTGDDYCLVSTGALPLAHAVFDTGKLGPDSLARFPRLAVAQAAASVREDGKLSISLPGSFPGQITERLRLRAVVLPRVAAATGRAVPVTAAQALRAVAPSTLLQLAAAGTSALSAMAQLTRRLPAYRLDVGPDVDAIPAAIGELIGAVRP